MDIAVTILQEEGEKVSAASVKGNSGKTNKLGSFKQANDYPELFMHNNICLVISFHFAYGWLYWIFRWVLSDHIPSSGSFALLQSMGRNLLKQLGNSWHQDPKVMPDKVTACFSPLFLVLLNNKESKMLREFSFFLLSMPSTYANTSCHFCSPFGSE